MKTYIKSLQKLRILTSFYRNQVQFFVTGITEEEQFGFGVKERCKFSAGSIDPFQQELVALLQDESLPLKKRLMAIVTRLQTALEELNDNAEEAEREAYQKLAEFVHIDICEMQCLLGDFIPEADD